MTERGDDDRDDMADGADVSSDSWAVRTFDERHERRNAQRRSLSLYRFLDDPRLLALSGADGVVEDPCRPSLVNTENGPAQSWPIRRPIIASSERAILKDERQKRLDFILWAIIGYLAPKSDKVSNMILKAIVTPIEFLYAPDEPPIDEIRLQDTKLLSELIGLNIREIETAKERMRYRISKIPKSLRDEALDILKEVE